MKKLILLAACLTWFGLPSANAQPTNPPGNYHPWWRDRPFGRAYTASQTNPLPLIRVQGNKFVRPDGQAVLFRGVSISDPDKIANQGHWNKAHFEKVKEMGATLVRIPVHPAAWRDRTPREYLKLLDQAVDWCTELNLHIIIDWHTIGNLHMELFQDPMYDTTQKETFEFWRTIAQHFRTTRTIAFYELFNEPTLYRGQLGHATWSEWKKLNEEMIRLIRAYDTEKIPLVAGFDWAYDLTPLREDPIAADGIGYVTHPYANKRSKPWPPKWEEDFGFAADRYPVFATEFGFPTGRRTEEKNDDYGATIVRYLEDRGISWSAWCFDPEWGPTLLKSWNYDLTGSGEFFKQAMQSKDAK
jgi:endoglucanase